MLSIQTVFVKPTVPELPPTVEDKQKEKVNDDVLGTQEPHSIKRPPIYHHCGRSGHVQPQCSLLKAQKVRVKKEVPKQVHYGTRPAAQHQTPWHQAPHQAPRIQYQAPWSHQRPQQRFVLAYHKGTYKNKPKQFRRPQEEQHYSEPPIWMQNMMEWMMQSCQQPPTGRQAWVENDSYPMRGNRRT